MENELTPSSQFFLYNSDDGKIRLEVHLKDETLWLTQNEMALLFGVGKAAISKHLKNIYQEGELQEVATVSKMETVRHEGARHVSRLVDYYNLDAIISVGYRVNSIRGTQFRIWATQRLKEYVIKGFAIDDERLKNNGDTRYFEELLAKIRDIRSSEKLFYQKVLDIYATSIDYDPRAATSHLFFQTVQNKLHWGAHGHTAPQLIYKRADASQPNMGLTNWPGNRITKHDTEVAKNYLTSEELEILNRIVTAYLEFAELQATNHNPMTMQDWINKLDDFIKLSGRSVLTNAGNVSHTQAKKKAHQEYEKYRQARLNAPSPVKRDYSDAMRELKTIEEHAKCPIRKRSFNPHTMPPGEER